MNLFWKLTTAFFVIKISKKMIENNDNEIVFLGYNNPIVKVGNFKT